jgi:hypothetical protein
MTDEKEEKAWDIYDKEIHLREREDISLPKLPLSADPHLCTIRKQISQSSQCYSGTR